MKERASYLHVEAGYSGQYKKENNMEFLVNTVMDTTKISQYYHQE